MVINPLEVWAKINEDPKFTAFINNDLKKEIIRPYVKMMPWVLKEFLYFSVDLTSVIRTKGKFLNRVLNEGLCEEMIVAGDCKVSEHLWAEKMSMETSVYFLNNVDKKEFPELWKKVSYDLFERYLNNETGFLYFQNKLTIGGLILIQPMFFLF